MSCHRADTDLGEAISWWLIIQGLFCNGLYTITFDLHFAMIHNQVKVYNSVKCSYWTCPGCRKPGRKQKDSAADLIVADRCFASWGYSSFMKVQLALNYYQVTVAASTSNWSSFLNYESAPKLQFFACVAHPHFYGGWRLCQFHIEKHGYDWSRGLRLS